MPVSPTMIGHKPTCAVLAATRFAEFPRQERINSLRPYLIRYNLFPPRRDPETAPIRMEELKGLVRKWKLHHERNFWRNHQNKDDVVNALHQVPRPSARTPLPLPTLPPRRPPRHAFREMGTHA